MKKEPWKVWKGMNEFNFAGFREGEARGRSWREGKLYGEDRHHRLGGEDIQIR